MVSLNTLFTLGILGAGLLAFTSLGGAGGIGQRIGGGFKAFQDNLLSGFTGALNPFGAAATGEPIIDLTLTSDPSKYTDPKTVILPEEYNPTANGGAVDTSPLPPATPIQTTPEPKVETGIPNQGGGTIPISKPFFQADGRPVVDYTSRISQYVSQPLTVLTPSVAAKQDISRAQSTFLGEGYSGYGTAAKQNSQLKALIATNAQKYGSFFN